MGASLSDFLFSFVLKQYIFCDVCKLRSPSFKCTRMFYISPTDTSSMQNLILQGLQQKLQKSCSLCKKNTWHVKSSYILQPPKYLILFVNRFSYINNNVTKDKCSIPMDKTVTLGPLKYSCGLDDVFPSDDLCSRPESLYIYIYMLSYMSSVFFGLPIVSCSLMIIV